MALKTDRQVDATEIGYYLNGTASKGVVVSVSTAGSGVGLDLSQNVCGVAATPSGNRPLGVLLQDVIDHIEMDGDYFKKKTMLMQVGSNHMVYKIFKE
jgi:hypothetical protein